MLFIVPIRVAIWRMMDDAVRRCIHVDEVRGNRIHHSSVAIVFVASLVAICVDLGQFHQ